MTPFTVIPAQAGIHPAAGDTFDPSAALVARWIPAFAGMTAEGFAR